MQAGVRILSIEPEANFTEGSTPFNVEITVRVSADDEHLDLVWDFQGQVSLNSAIKSALGETARWAERLTELTQAAYESRPNR